MKYVKPTVEFEILETTDILSASTGAVEIETTGEGTGNVIFNAFDLFGTK